MNPPPLTANSINFWKNGTKLSSEISGIAFMDGQCNQRLANGSLLILHTNHKQRCPLQRPRKSLRRKLVPIIFPVINEAVTSFLSQKVYLTHTWRRCIRFLLWRNRCVSCTGAWTPAPYQYHQPVKITGKKCLKYYSIRQQLKFLNLTLKQKWKASIELQIIIYNMRSNQDGDGYGLNKIRPCLRILAKTAIHKRQTCLLLTWKLK